MKKIVLSIILILIAAAGLYAYYSYAIKHVSNEVSEIKHASKAVSGKTLEFDYPVFRDWNVKVYDNRIEYRPKPILGIISMFQPASSIEIDAVDLPEGYPKGGVWPSVNGFGVGYEADLKESINMNVQFESGFSFSRGFGSYANQVGFDYEKVLETIAESFREIGTSTTSYYRVKDVLMRQGWLPVVPGSYTFDSKTTTTPIDAEFPEISYCGSGKGAVCRADFKKDGDVKRINLQHSESNEGWFVVESGS